MQVDRAINTMLSNSELSAEAVSGQLGRAKTYVRNVAAAGRNPALGTVADIADVLGVDVALIDRATGKALGTVDPPRRALE